MNRSRIRYTRRGWYGVLHFLTGARDLYTGERFPDEYGHFERKLLAGPYATAEEAAKAWRAA